MVRRTSLKTILFSGAAFAAMSIAAPASAQTDPADDAVASDTEAAQTAAAEPENRQDIVVTGTRVIRDGFQAPTPLTVLTKDDIDNTSPTNNIADFVNQLPQLAGSTKPANSRLNISNGSAGINALNMRNLGEGRVLILVDGRRSVGSTIFGWVDINTIPQALVDRVEVVTGGASSAYGSDAVSGVVNFVLNKKYEGLLIEGDMGVTTVGDGFNYSGSIAGGTAFAGGRGHVIFNAEIAHQDGIFSVDPDDRPWNHTGYVAVTNPAYNATTNSSVPQFLTTLRGIGVGNQTPGGLITASTGGVANRLRGLYFGQGGAVAQFQYGTGYNFPALGGAAVTTRTQGPDAFVNDSGRRIGLNPRDDRYGFFGRASFEVADGVELFAEGSYNHQEVFFNAGPNLGSYNLNTTGCTTVPVPITCNAFALQSLGAAQLAGVTQISVTSTGGDLPFRGINNQRKVQRYVVGAEGSFDAFDKPARWDVYAQYGRSDVREQLRDIQHLTNLTNATNAAFAPAGNAGGYAAGSIQCLINLDANPNNNDPACVPLNRLGLGVADPAGIDYALGDPYRDQVLEQRVAGANLSLTPFATWAGDVSIAVGAEYREEKIRGTVPLEFQPIINPNGTTTNRWSVGNYLPFTGKYNVKEAYLETVDSAGYRTRVQRRHQGHRLFELGLCDHVEAGCDMGADRGYPPPSDSLARHPGSQSERAVSGRHRQQRLRAQSQVYVGRPERSAILQLFGTDDRQSRLASGEGQFLECRRRLLTALPARVHRLGRLLPDRPPGRDRLAQRPGDRQPLRRRPSGILRRHHQRSDPVAAEQSLSADPYPAVQFREPPGARSRLRRGLSQALRPRAACC